jgi:Flp pilus assembly protein TadG
MPFAQAYNIAYPAAITGALEPESGGDQTVRDLAKDITTNKGYTATSMTVTANAPPWSPEQSVLTGRLAGSMGNAALLRLCTSYQLPARIDNIPSDTDIDILSLPATVICAIATPAGLSYGGRTPSRDATLLFNDPKHTGGDRGPEARVPAIRNATAHDNPDTCVPSSTDTYFDYFNMNVYDSQREDGNADSPSRGRPPTRQLPVRAGFPMKARTDTRGTIARKFHCGGPTKQRLRPWLFLLRDRDGIAALEFAVVAPVLFMLLFGIIQVGITFNNYLLLTNAVITGARTLSVSRGAATPFADTTNAIKNSAPTLTAAQLNAHITTRVNGTACASDTACASALNTATGQTAFVMATYPCDLTIMGVSYAPGCTLTSQAAQMIQ